MYTRIYSFHGIVCLKVVSSKKQYIRFLDDEYRHIAKVDPTEKFEADILIYIDCEFPPNTNEKSDNYFSWKFKKFFPVKYLILEAEGKETIVYFKGDISIHFYSFIMCAFLLNEIIDPLLYMKFLWKDYIIMHSACVSDGKKGFLFGAAGGAGKTTLALKLVGRGMTFLNDDKTIVSNTGVVYAYPRSLRLYTYNLKSPPCNSFSWSLKSLIYGKDIFRFIASMVLRTKVYLATRVHLHDIFPDAQMGTSFQLGKLFLLTAENGKECKKLVSARSVENNSTDYIMDLLIKSCELNEKLKDKILADRRDLIERIENKEKEILEDIMEKLECVYQLNSHILNDQNINEFKSMMEA
jgi:hypothetical protein